MTLSLFLTSLDSLREVPELYPFLQRTPHCPPHPDCCLRQTHFQNEVI